VNRWRQFLKASTVALLIAGAALASGRANAQEKSIVVASTTSTQDSGLFGYLLPIAEEKFLAEGFSLKRYPVMYNDFVLIGPKADPAGVKAKDILMALQTIRARGAPFISRGDRSGTNIAELALWNEA